MALGPAGTADAVDVVLNLVGHVVVEHHVHVVDVQAPGGHVGGHQHPHLALPEGLEGLFPDALLDVAVDGLGGDAPHLEQAGEPVGHVLGVAEGDGPLVAAVGEKSHHGLQLVPPALQVNAVLLDVRLVLLVGPHHNLHRVTLVHPGDVHHLTGDGGGEEAQVLPGLDLVQNPGHVVDEAHIQHPVGLVQHHGLHLVQLHRAPLHVVHKAAGGGHHNLGMLFQGGNLLLNGGAAVEAHRAHTLLKLTQVPQLVLNLEGQLTGGGQHQGLHRVTLRVDVLHHGDAEGKGLARAGGSLGDDVLPLHKVGDGARLDRGGPDIALLVDGLHHLGREAQVRVVHNLIYLFTVDFHADIPFFSR